MLPEMQIILSIFLLVVSCPSEISQRRKGNKSKMQIDFIRCVIWLPPNLQGLPDALKLNAFSGCGASEGVLLTTTNIIYKKQRASFPD
jgi:hypothetical protein